MQTHPEKITALEAPALSEWDVMLARIRGWFEAGVSATTAMTGVAAELRRLGKPGVEAHLRACLRDDAALQAIAARSHFHGNGFYKIVLADDPAFRLRLHIWPAGCDAQENLHSHRWHFASTVLSGRLESEIWEDAVAPQDASYDEYLYFGFAAGKQPYDLPVGKARVVLRERVVQRAGEAYTMLPHVMHRIVSSGREMTSTLACHTATAKCWARTISITGSMPDSAQRFLTPDDLRQVFRDYLEAPCNDLD
jgi:hypothetical protein